MSGYIYPPNECIAQMSNSQYTFINICEVKNSIKSNVLFQAFMEPLHYGRVYYWTNTQIRF